MPMLTFSILFFIFPQLLSRDAITVISYVIGFENAEKVTLMCVCEIIIGALREGEFIKKIKI